MTDMPQATASRIEQLMLELELPDHYREFIDAYVRPLNSALLELHREKKRPLLVGVNGAQGTGKTTLCRFLHVMLEDAGLSVVTLSIDDFYYSRRTRVSLSDGIHPLMKTRGVPGTHDTILLHDTLISLLRGERVPLPIFDKAMDDSVPREHWRLSSENTDIIVFEGWCVGAQAENKGDLLEPLNDLERNDDVDGSWRRYVNNRLKSDYADIFAMLDYIVMLKAPSFDIVYEWRLKQEKQLARNAKDATHIMNDEGVQRFIQYYERITRSVLAQLPDRADVVFHLSTDHKVTSATGL